MEVELIGYTKATEKFEDDIGDLKDLVVYCARVSNPENQMNMATADRLVSYLLKNAHFSPFEMVNVVLRVKTTRDMSHQLIRHRSFTFQEYSQRYSTVDEGFVLREARLQDPKNRQNSISDGVPEWLETEWMERQTRIARMIKDDYIWAVNNGMAKEVARAILPEGMTPTTVIVNGTLRSWIHYCALRAANGTQKEHMLIAKACADAISEIFEPMLEIIR